MRTYPRSALSRNSKLWRLWADGFSLEQIGRALGKPAGSIYMAAASCGGIAPPERRRGSEGLEPGGARGDLAWHCGGPVDTANGAPDGALAFDGESRDRSK